MKLYLIFILIYFSAGILHGQTKNTATYLPYKSLTNTAYFYKSQTSTYVDHYKSEREMIDEHEYFVRVRLYSWREKRDTTYFREDSLNFYSYNPRIGLESVQMPKAVYKGMIWYEADSSWLYEVVGISETLETPVQVYTDLLHIECRQITNRDPQKFVVYNLFYAESIGLVGSKQNGRLNSFLAEIRSNPQHGDKIGY